MYAYIYIYICIHIYICMHNSELNTRNPKPKPKLGFTWGSYHCTFSREARGVSSFLQSSRHLSSWASLVGVIGFTVVIGCWGLGCRVKPMLRSPSKFRTQVLGFGAYGFGLGFRVYQATAIKGFVLVRNSSSSAATSC